MTSETVAESVVRGQYVAGTSGSAEVPAYRDELTDAPASHTETFVALKAEIDNDRWRGVPFYIRSGKRLPKKVTEVVVHFRAADDSLFGSTQRPARLVIRIDPNDTITMPLAVKKIAPGDFLLADHPLSTHLGTEGSGALPDAYEGLMLDAAQGYPGLFVRKDENEAAWQWVEPILESWANNPTIPDRYPAGTWGPDSARRLLTDSGHAWLEDAA
jgi:glucose-6-phosphate 1-dehydrogenase